MDGPVLSDLKHCDKKRSKPSSVACRCDKESDKSYEENRDNDSDEETKGHAFSGLQLPVTNKDEEKDKQLEKKVQITTKYHIWKKVKFVYEVELHEKLTKEVASLMGVPLKYQSKSSSSSK